MLEKSYFLLKFFRIVGESMGRHDILFISRPSLHIIKMMPFLVQDNFSWVIEEDSRDIIRQ